MSKETGGPAFPHLSRPIHGEFIEVLSDGGMTLRDYCAIAALPAIVAAYVEANGRCLGTDHIHYNCAAHAYKMADAMLTERSKP